MSELESACKDFLAKWELILPHINNAFLMDAVHGHKYDGPTIGDEIERMRRALTPTRVDNPPVA